MLVTHDGTWYWAHTEYADRLRVKEAGFLWDAVAGKWKTKFPARAAALRPYCDDGALAALADHFSRLEASRATDSAIEVPAPAGLAYLPYQKAGIAFAMNRTATLLGDQPGLGKSIQVLGVINASLDIRRVLIICPVSIKLNWEREANKWLVRDTKVQVVSDNSWTASQVDGAETVVIVNYERAVKLQAELAKVTWDLVVTDECHYAKNPETKRSQATYALAMAAKRRMVLTGTPILNKPVELQPLAGMCDPDRFGDPRVPRTKQKWNFLMRYCGAHKEIRGRREVWVFDGATHLDELQERLRASCMIRRLKEDVLPELPAKRRQIVPLEGVDFKDPRDARSWWEALRDAEEEAALALVSKDKAAYAEAAKKLKYLNTVEFTEMAAYRHRLGLAKVDAGGHYVLDLLEGGVEKVVVFAHHREVMTRLIEIFEEADMHPVHLWGGMDDAHKQASVDRFQTDPTCRVFVGQIQAAGVGLTLTAASHVVAVEQTWVPAEMTQAEDRCHRITQKDIVFVHHLVVDDTLDAHIVKKVVRKQEIADQALDLEPEYEQAGTLAEMPKPKTTVRKVPDNQRAALLQALRFLAARCDGAVAEDGQGFNGNDSGFGKRLAALSDLTDGQFYAGWRMVQKYKKTQLPGELVVALGLDGKLEAALTLLS